MELQQLLIKEGVQTAST